MEISRELVEYVADLAHLELTEDEIKIFTRQLGDMIHYFEKIREVETEDAPDSEPEVVSSVTRPDAPQMSLSAEDALRNAPSSSGFFFRVPKVIP